MFRRKYLLEVNYKSGTRKRFWVYKFTVRGGLETVEWTPVNEHKPITLNVDQIESLWQVAVTRFWCGRV